MTFHLFDPRSGFSIRKGNLPHWYQPNVTYFVTFRTDDSIPVELAASWHRQREEWLQQHGIDPQTDWEARLRQLPDPAQREFGATFAREFMEYLDRGYGECLLKQPAVAQIVAHSLRHFDGERYHLGDFVVMPNHVHLLVCLRDTTEIEEQCYSWKRFTAGKINRFLGRRGRFWQEESFDHLIRSPEQFEYLQEYIAENPHKAGLRETAFLYYHRSDP